LAQCAIVTGERGTPSSMVIACDLCLLQSTDEGCQHVRDLTLML
jgi:hypothetical protein